MDELKKRLRALVDERKQLNALALKETREFTDEEQNRWDETGTEIESIKTQIERAQEVAAMEQYAADLKPERRKTPADSADKSEDEPREEKQKPRVEVTHKRYGRLHNITDEAKAFRFGQWCMAAAGNKRSAAWCADNGIELRLHKETTNSTGGFLVPDEFDNELIDLREQYGVFRRNARIVPMGSDLIQRRRRAGGLTAYFPGEGGSGTESTKSWDLVTLTAKKAMVLATYTSELAEDAVLNIGDDLAGEIAYAFANKEDECGFNGTGTSTYAGINGVINRLNNTGTAGIVTAASGTNTDWSGVTMANLTEMISLIPDYAETPNLKFFCSKGFWGSVLLDLQMDAGGNTAAQIAQGGMKMFGGYPVEVSQVLPKSADSAEIVCLFGDLRLAADFGDRRQTTIAFSEDAVVDDVSVFETDEIAIRGTQRFDINVHSVGDSSDAGPIVALKTAS